MPGDVGTAAAAELLDLAELIERVLKFLTDQSEPLELGRFGLLFFGTDNGELLLAELLQRRQVRVDHLVEIGGAEGALGDAGQKRVGPSLEQLLTVARQLKLPLELLVGDS